MSTNINATTKPVSMASPYNVQLSTTASAGHIHVDDLQQESADKVSELLMVNHAKYHTFFNEVGLHNHIVHHLMSLWALGAKPNEIQAAYDLNKKYQLTHYHHDAKTSTKMKDPIFFKEHLGESPHYGDYLQFFQDELAERGVEDVVRDYVFKGDKRADDLLGRMYSGFEHPIIHLGFGLEFNQPCLVAEALASAAVHDDWPIPIVQPVESYVSSTSNLPQNSYLSVIQSLRSDPIVSTAVKPTDPPNRVTDGLVKRAGSALLPLLAKWRVNPTESDISYRTAEMIHGCTYVIAAAQNPRKEISFDFFLMHSMNLSIFYPVFMGCKWLSLEQRARLLTWKGWMDFVIYAACGCPQLYYSRITHYHPKKPGDWASIIARVNSYPDDGHTSKLVRAIFNAEKISFPYTSTDSPDFPLNQEDFLKIAHMTMDSVERLTEPGYKLPGSIRKLYVDRLGSDEEVAKIAARFVRWCGVEGAWDDCGIPDLDVGDRARL